MWRFASLALVATCSLTQQEYPSQPSTLTVTTQVVAVDALVRDADGELNLALPKETFTLKVDGKTTPIRYFNRDNDLPLTVGLLIDTSGSERVFFDEEERSSEEFLTNTLTHSEDRALIVRFDSRIATLQPLTGRLNLLHNGLRQLDYTPPEPGPGATRLYDAIAEVSHTFNGRQEGRRAMVLLTDGEENGSQIDEKAAVREAQRANVAVYGVLYSTAMIGGSPYPTAPGMRPTGISIMQDISRATGGRTFVVGGGTPIREIYAEIERELRSQYRFGFTPPASKPGKYHSLELRTADKHQTVQARGGYYTPE